MPISEVFNEDCIIGMKRLKDESVNIILTDPPYLYLDHKLDIEFDEGLFFNECKRVLKKSGFIVLFGRGTSFYRWNTILAELKFVFKEEVIWNKRRISSPALPIARVHETVSIHSKGKTSINNTKVNYGELKGYDLDKIENDLMRLAGLFNKGKAYAKVVENLRKINEGEKWHEGIKDSSNKITFASDNYNVHVGTYQILAIENGCREQSIISDADSHYDSIHPTQKPVRLLERLLDLVKKGGDVVIDPFMGSQSSRIAAYQMGFDYYGWEIDREYFEAGNKRFAEQTAQLKLL